MSPFLGFVLFVVSVPVGAAIMCTAIWLLAYAATRILDRS